MSPSGATPVETLIASWFYADPIGKESLYPQVRGLSSKTTFHDVYLKCLAVSMASSTRMNPGARHAVVINDDRIFRTDVGERVASILEALDVMILKAPFSFEVPLTWHHAWRNQFYLFDVINCLTAHAPEGGGLVVVDSDVIWNRSGAQLAEAVARDGFVTYAIPYGEEAHINGLTLQGLRSMYACEDGVPVETYRDVKYCGGEFVAVSTEQLAGVNRDIRDVWRRNVRRHENRLAKCNEEAQMLGHVYARHGAQMGNGNRYIRRIWTGPRTPRNGVRGDLDLTLWHLPSEKRTGFAKMFDLLGRHGLNFGAETDEEWRQLAARIMGVPQPGVFKTAYDSATLAIARVRSR